MTPRGWKRIALFVGIPLLVLGCVGIICLVVCTPEEEVVLGRREIPSDWLAPPATQTGPLAVAEEIGQPADVTARNCPAHWRSWPTGSDSARRAMSCMRRGKGALAWSLTARFRFELSSPRSKHVSRRRSSWIVISVPPAIHSIWTVRWGSGARWRGQGDPC